MNSVQQESGSDKTQKAIVATNVIAGEGDVVGSCDLKLGSALIYGVSVRRGRQGSLFVNMPHRRHPDGSFTPIVEITTPSVKDACDEVVLRAVLEATR